MRSSSPLLLAVTATLYALNYPLGALALTAMSPFLLITLRFVVTGAVLWAVVLIARSALPRGRGWWHAVGAGLLTQGAQFLGAYWAMSHGVGAGVTALIVALNPVVVTVVSSVLSRRRDSVAGYLPVGIGALAVVLACLPRILRDPHLGAASIAVVVALLGLSLGSVWQGRALQGVSPVSFTAIGVTASLPLAGTLMLTAPQSVTPGARTWLLFAVVTMVGLLGTTLYASSVMRVGARSASSMFAVIPALAAGFAAVLLGEAWDLTLAIALVLGCIACLLDLCRGSEPRGSAAERGQVVGASQARGD